MAGRLWNPRATALEHCEVHLTRVCDAVSSPDKELLLEALNTLTRYWSDAAIEDLQLGDVAVPDGTGVLSDFSPVEISLKTSRNGSVVRFSAALALDRAVEQRTRGLALLDELQRAYGVDPSSLHRILDAISKTDAADQVGHHWLFGVEPANGVPGFRVYLWSPATAWPAALGALGIHRVPHDASGVDYLPFGFSLDLIPHMSESSRVKLYCTVRGPVFENLVKLAGLDPEFAPEHAQEFLTSVTGGNRESLDDTHPIATVYVPTDPTASPRVNLLVSVGLGAGRKALSDQEASQRVVATYEKFGLDPTLYLAALHSVARVDLSREYLIHSYCALQFSGGAPSLTTYFSTRVFAYSKRAAHRQALGF